MTMRFLTDALLMVRIVSRGGTGRIFVPFVTAASIITGMVTRSVALGLAVPVAMLMHIAFQTRSSPTSQRMLADERARADRGDPA